MRRFRWKSKGSRAACIAATVIRAMLGRITVEEALAKSLDKYCDNGDLITEMDRDWLLEDVRAGMERASSVARKAM